jgi:hypothetical protein
MFAILHALGMFVANLFKLRSRLEAENLFLRHQLTCAKCHATADEDASPKHTAPRFKDVANTFGMTATALRVWLQSSHPTMPNIILEPNDLSNVVAYILS